MSTHFTRSSKCFTIIRSARSISDQKCISRIRIGTSFPAGTTVVGTFPAYGGHNLFRARFSPCRTTVFGIETHNQDIYDKEELQRLIAMAVQTCKFRMFAGEKYDIHTCNVAPSAGEKAVYRKVMKEFLRLCALFTLPV